MNSFNHCLKYINFWRKLFCYPHFDPREHLIGNIWTGLPVAGLFKAQWPPPSPSCSQSWETKSHRYPGPARQGMSARRDPGFQVSHSPRPGPPEIGRLLRSLQAVTPWVLLRWVRVPQRPALCTQQLFSSAYSKHSGAGVQSQFQYPHWQFSPRTRSLVS